MTHPQVERQSAFPRGSGGKYLAFTLGSEAFALPILKVREIIGCLPITVVPGMPPHVKGVVNLRGQVVGITDLRVRFNMPAAEITERTCIIVVESAAASTRGKTGFLVDTVSEVLEIPDSNIEALLTLGSALPPDFVLGIARAGTGVKILLDAERLLTFDASAGSTKATAA